MVLPGPLRHCFFCGRFLAFFETEAVLRTLLTMPRAGARLQSAPPTARRSIQQHSCSTTAVLFAVSWGTGVESGRNSFLPTSRCWMRRPIDCIDCMRRSTVQSSECAGLSKILLMRRSS
jgi:hypothetical protein